MPRTTASSAIDVFGRCVSFSFAFSGWVIGVRSRSVFDSRYGVPLVDPVIRTRSIASSSVVSSICVGACSGELALRLPPNEIPGTGILGTHNFSRHPSGDTQDTPFQLAVAWTVVGLVARAELGERVTVRGSNPVSCWRSSVFDSTSPPGPVAACTSRANL